MAGHDLSVCRVDRIAVLDDDGVIIDDGSSVRAESSGAKILFTDLFFGRNEDLQLIDLVHELTHTVDGAGIYSHSPEFVNLVTARMEKYCVAETGSTNGFSKAEGDKVAKSYGLPSAYACTNLHECLAECTATFLCKGEGYLSKDICEFIKTRVLKQDVFHSLILSASMEYEEQGDLSKALMSTSRFLQANPDSFAARFLRANIWLRKGDFEMAWYEAGQIRQLLKKMQISVLERMYYHTVQVELEALNALGLEKESQALADQEDDLNHRAHSQTKIACD